MNMARKFTEPGNSVKQGRKPSSSLFLIAPERVSGEPRALTYFFRPLGYGKKAVNKREVLKMLLKIIIDI